MPAASAHKSILPPSITFFGKTYQFHYSKEQILKSIDAYLKNAETETDPTISLTLLDKDVLSRGEMGKIFKLLQQTLQSLDTQSAKKSCDYNRRSI